MRLENHELNPTQNYHLLIQSIIPRPIAWILTANDEETGGYNLAPFSFFTPVCSNPPTFVVSMGRKPSGEQKDTFVNLQRDGRCVVHIASVEQLQALNNSSATLAYGDSEIERTGLELVEQEGGELPRLKDAAIAFNCRYSQCVDVGVSQQHVVFVEALSVDICDEVIASHDPRLQISAEKLQPLARLGGADYAALGERFNLPRPE